MADISLNKDSRFDVDLAFGNIREERVADIFENKKIEVKTERGIWTRSGNIAIEIEWNGKPSGIMTTQADYWFHILEKDEQEICMISLPIEKLRQLVLSTQFRRVKGGDDMKAVLVLIPLRNMFQILGDLHE